MDFQTTVTFVTASCFRSQDWHCHTGRLSQKVLGPGNNIHDRIVWNRNISLNLTSFKSTFIYSYSDDQNAFLYMEDFNCPFFF